MWEDDNEGFVACFLIKKGKAFNFLTKLGAKRVFFPLIMLYLFCWMKMVQRQHREEGDIWKREPGMLYML